MSLIPWREWNPEAFDAARRQNKPVLLDIGAVWCHWCHVMDEGIPGDRVHTGTYNDPTIANLINDRYVAIKVDNDRRPDINARYNMGGWPSTVFLTPEGEIIYGETYVPPGRMLSLLKYIADSYRDNRSEIARRVGERAISSEQAAAATVSALALPAQAPDRVAAEVVDNFDYAYGGFGHQLKFPHIGPLRFALSRAARGDEEMAEIVKTTLTHMAGGGTYDRFAGGFFRYSTTRDWSIPHYEKMLEDNALLSDLCMRAGYLLDDGELIQVGMSVHRWLLSTMQDLETGCFYGSQDADKEEYYYGKSLIERAALPTPYIDRTIYAGWNFLMVSSLVTRYRLMVDPNILSAASRAYKFVVQNVLPHHFWAEGKCQGTENLLSDLVGAVRAALDLGDVTGEEVYLDDAIRFADTMVSELSDPRGGFFDIKPEPGAIGALAKPNREIVENSEAAIVLLRLGARTGDRKHQVTAERALAGFADSYRPLSFYAAPFAQAVAASLEPSVRVVLTGSPSDEAFIKLREAIWLAPSETLTWGVAQVSPNTDYPPDPNGEPQAYVCVGTNCSAPVRTVAELNSLLRPPLPASDSEA